MMFASLISALAASPLAFAMPTIKGVMLHSSAAMTLNFAHMELTNVGLNCTRPKADVDYTCGLKFDWFDPNSVRQNNVSSATCNQSWTWDGKNIIGGDDNSLDTPYQACYQSEDRQTYFGMRLMTFVNPTNFTLQLTHSYQDSENFTAPWDWPTTFAQPTINLTIPADEVTPGDECRLFDAGPFYAEVNGVSI